MGAVDLFAPVSVPLDLKRGGGQNTKFSVDKSALVGRSCISVFVLSVNHFHGLAT